MALYPIVALEIGTHKICALVGEAREDGHIMITGIGECRSCGVQKGIILDIEAVVSCIRMAIQGAEQTATLDIRQVYLTISGCHIKSMVSLGTYPIFDADQGITSNDVEEVMNIARSVNLPSDSEVLHTIPLKYFVDDQHGVINPEGMHGGKLALNMLVIHGSRNLLNNSLQAVSGIGVEVVEMVFSGLCSALATLTPEQKERGVILIDCGAGTTSYVVYADGAIATIGVLAVGGDHITNDISLCFNLSLKRAERLKHESASAILDSSTHFQRISIPAEVGFSACSIAVSDLNVIINARVDEMFGMIRNDLEKKSLSHQLGAGVVLTGGGALLKGIETAVERVFDMRCIIGKPRGFSGMGSAYEGPEYAAPLGLIRYAVKNASSAVDSVSIIDFVKRMLGMET